MMAIQNIAEAGDNVVSSTDLYGGTWTLFASSLKKMGVSEELKLSFALVPKPAAANGGGSVAAAAAAAQQPLCQWAEVAGHPGLMTAFYQTSNNPVVLMIRPDAVFVQEIKIGTKGIPCSAYQ